MFPSDAAVMPLASEETTPPVTKTYFDIDDLQGGFSNVTGDGGRLNLRFRFWLQNDHLGLVLGAGGLLERQLGMRLRRSYPTLLEEQVDGTVTQIQNGVRILHEHH